MAKLDVTPEIEAAIADVRDAASAFGDETAHFANGKYAGVWCTWASCDVISPRVFFYFAMILATNKDSDLIVFFWYHDVHCFAMAAANKMQFGLTAKSKEIRKVQLQVSWRSAY